jgi:hypothetical protein
VTGAVYLNGTTDYVEAYGYLQTAGSVDNASTTTIFQGALLRGA